MDGKKSLASIASDLRVLSGLIAEQAAVLESIAASAQGMTVSDLVSLLSSSSPLPLVTKIPLKRSSKKVKNPKVGKIPPEVIQSLQKEYSELPPDQQTKQSRAVLSAKYNLSPQMVGLLLAIRNRQSNSLTVQ